MDRINDAAWNIRCTTTSPASSSVYWCTRCPIKTPQLKRYNKAPNPNSRNSKDRMSLIIISLKTIRPGRNRVYVLPNRRNLAGFGWLRSIRPDIFIVVNHCRFNQANISFPSEADYSKHLGRIRVSRCDSNKSHLKLEIQLLKRCKTANLSRISRQTLGPDLIRDSDSPS